MIVVAFICFITITFGSWKLIRDKYATLDKYHIWNMLCGYKTPSLSIISKSGGLKESAVAGKPSVTRLTQRSWTGMRASGTPNAAAKKIETTSPMLELEWIMRILFELFSKLPDQITDKLLHVVVDCSSFFNSSNNWAEVIISKNHILTSLLNHRNGAVFQFKTRKTTTFKNIIF